MIRYIIAFAFAAANAVNVNEYFRDSQYCTAIAVSPGATFDGSSMTTHNNDCAECDLRVTHVPAKDWPAGSQRPIFGERNAYPKFAEMPEYNVHGPPYLLSNVDTSIYPWPAMAPFFYIDQAAHTYGYTMGSYAIQNEKQVSMGESTCRGIFYSTPAYAGGKAHMNVRVLMEIALERCDTARCAIIMMGDLAVKYGFYGAAPADDTPDNQQNEAGEALTVSDKTEAWIFHILPDDTGTSAIWAAQRVPDGHIAAVANQWIITTLNLDDTDNYMASANVFDAAERNNLWSSTSGEPFSFLKAYNIDRPNYGPMCTRRIWRVFTLAAPSLLPIFSAFTDGIGSFGYGEDGSQPYPFSVKPDNLLSLQDVFAMNRDQYEGTPFDLSQGTDAGPFGDTMRYPTTSIARDPVHGMTPAELVSGLGFPRAISLWRTAYSTVTQSRSSLPDEIGAVTWIAPYAPHYSTFLPIYAASEEAPSAIAVGTQYKFDKDVNFWIHCLTGNYLTRWYAKTINATRTLQKSIEASIFAQQAKAEASAVTKINSVLSTLVSLQNGNSKVAPSAAQQARNVRQQVLKQLQEFHEDIGKQINQKWWAFFWESVVTFRDIYHVTDFHAENFAHAAGQLMTYPRWWLEQIGYWGKPGTPTPGEESQPILPINIPAQPSQQAYEKAYPNGFWAPYPTVKSPPLSMQSASLDNFRDDISYQPSSMFLVVVGAVIGSIVTFIALKYGSSSQRNLYTPIQDAL